MLSRLTLPLSSLVLSSILFFGAPLSTAVAAEEAKETKLYLNWKAEPEFGGFYAAELNGHFTKAGLKIKIEEGGSGTPVAQMVAAGKVDLGISSADEILLARDKGSDLIALFVAYKTNPQGVMIHGESKVASMKDVFATEGNLAIAPGFPYTLFLKKKFEKEMKVNLVPYNGGIGPFLADKNFRQQCFVTSEPLAAKKAGAKPKTFLISAEGFDPYATVVVTRKAFLDKNPELVKKFVVAVRAGWKDYLKDPKAANEHMQKLNASMDVATFNEIADTQKPFIVLKGDKDSDLGKMDTARWKKVGDALLDLKLITKQIEVKDLFINL